MILGPQGPGKVGQRGGFSYTRTAAHGQRHAGVAQLVEHYLAKVDVASSNLVSRSIPPTSSVGAFLLGLLWLLHSSWFKKRSDRVGTCLVALFLI